MTYEGLPIPKKKKKKKTRTYKIWIPNKHSYTICQFLFH